MSNSCSRLGNILKSKTAKISAASSPIPLRFIAGKPISVKEIAEEPNLDEVAKKMKQAASDSVKFRNRHNIYDFTISRLAFAKRFNLIEDILESHKQFEDITSEGFAIRLISLYAKSGMFDHARKLFDELPELNCQRTVKSFNALLKAGVESKRFDQVFSIFKEFPAKLSISCDVVSYNIIIHAHCEMGSFDDALFMIDEMKEKDLSPNCVTFNTLLDAFYRVKGFEEGEKIWVMMDEYNVVPNTRSYNLKMQALVNEGELKKATALYETFGSKGLKPDLNTFNVFIKAFCDQGDVEEAKKYYNALLESGANPNCITFASLVPKLCDFSDIELAFELCKKMFKRQFVVDEALLQLVVNKLFEDQMIDEAEELVVLGNSNSYVRYSLSMPSDDKKN